MEVHVSKLYPVPEALRATAHIDRARYDAMYRESIEAPDAFWSRQATEFLDWMAPFHTVRDVHMTEGRVAWFLGGKLNASVNCIDRHLPARAAQVAFFWEADEPGGDRRVTYQELYDEVCKLANLLRRR